MRSLELALGILLIITSIGYWLPATRQRVRSHCEWMHQRTDSWVQDHFQGILLAISTVFLVFALFAKWTQLKAFELNSQDFWLFEDMLRSLMRGEPFITRFAPQGLGLVQHGVIHPTWIWWTLVPFAFVIGPTGAALLFGPLYLSLAGYLLGRCAQPRWGKKAALVIAAAFLASTHVARVLMYDAHPEAAYPFFTFLFVWSQGIADGKKRFGITVLALIGLFSIKEDAFLVVLPLLAIFYQRLRTLWGAKGYWALAGVACAMMAVPMISISLLQAPMFGVMTPSGAGFLEGKNWDSPAGALWAILAVIQAKGGLIGVGTLLLKFFASRPFLTFVGTMPWGFSNPLLWVLILPLSVTFALLGGIPATLILYYSAPLLGLLWAFLAVATRSSHLRSVWVLTASLTLGSMGMTFAMPSQEQRLIAEQVESFEKCVPAMAKSGLVTPPLIGSWADRSRIFTDRFPQDSTNWAKVNFLIFAPKLPRFELNENGLSALEKRLQEESSEWRRLGRDCKAKQEDISTDDLVQFWVRSKL